MSILLRMKVNTLRNCIVDSRGRSKLNPPPAGALSEDQSDSESTEANEDQYNSCHSEDGPPAVTTLIDEVVLGAPLTADPGITDDGFCSLVTSPATAAATNLHTPKALYPQFKAGCVWDRDNWSCSYDSVFMSFFFIYKESPPAWRNKWTQQVPTWNKPLKAMFEKLLAMAQSGRYSQATLSQEFNSFREDFRDCLSFVNPECFNRYGKVPASVCRILSYLLGGAATQEPHLNQQLICNQCKNATHARCSFSLLGSTDLLRTFQYQDDPEFLPLQIAINRYIQHSSYSAHLHRCLGCPGSLGVGSLTMPDMTWLWIELCDPKSPVSPSLRLVFNAQSQRQAYNLRAVIYSGGNHFTARFFDDWDVWWNYDDMRGFGMPFTEHIGAELDLLNNDDRWASFLLYVREDGSD